MAVQAPVHVQGIHLIGQRHLIHLPVASGTADALVEVDAVIKVHEIRKVMYPGPLNRLAACPAIANRLRYDRV